MSRWSFGVVMARWSRPPSSESGRIRSCSATARGTRSRSEQVDDAAGEVDARAALLLGQHLGQLGLVDAQLEQPGAEPLAGRALASRHARSTSAWVATPRWTRRTPIGYAHGPYPTVSA